MSNNVRIQREIASRIFALIIVIILSTTIFSTTAIAPSGSSSGDILIPLSYPEAGGGIWVPKEVEPGHAYPVVVLLSGGDGHNAFVSPGTWKVEQRTVRPLLDQGKVHPFILVSPYAKDGSSASPIRNFNKDNFRLQELLATVDQLISQYGIAIDRNYITVAGHSNGGMFREQQPGANGVFAFISDVDTVPLYAVAILDGTHDIKSAEFIHLNLDGKPTKVFGYVGKNRQPGQLPNDWTNAFLGSDAVPCGVDYNTEFFRECKKAADRDWFNYVTYIGGPGLCDRTIPKGTPENVQCHKDNTRSHGHIPWEFFKDWFPRLYPPTLPAPTASIQIQPGLAAGAVPQPGAAPGAQPSGIAQQQGFRFIVFTDSHTRVPPSEIQKKLVKRMIELKPDLIISGGDMVSGVDGITAEEIAEHWGNFDELIRPIRDAGIPFLPSAGNHDKAIGGEVVEAAYNNKWSSYVVPGLDNFEGRFDAYYSFDHKNAHFVILDASRINLGNEQYAWLESDLNKAKESENIFVVGHVPLTRAREGVREDHVVPESKIRPVLKEANIKAYLAGHNHVYNELDVDGIKQISCGFSEYMKGGSIPLGGTEEQKQEDQSFVVFDVVGSTFTYYVVLGPDFTTTVDGREIPAEAPSAQAAEVLPAGGIPLAGTPPTASGFEGLYDIFFTSEAGNLVLRAIARYPIGMGVQAPTLESIVSLTPQTITPAAPTTAAAGAPAGVAAPAPTAIPPGTESGANLKCHYCSQAKAYIQQLYPEEYQACLSSNDICCEATCPQGSVIKSGVPYINQARAAMGEGGDCWHDGIPPDRPAGSTAGEDYGGSACGVAALRMALKGHGIDVSSKDLFCGSPQGSHTIFLISGGGETGGSGPGMMVNAAKALGRPETKFSNVVDWNDIVSSIKQGKVVIFYIGDRTKIGHGGVVQERCYTSVGHYIVLLGASDNFVIANDPGGHCGATGAENMVLSKTFIEGTARGYFVI